MSALPAGTIFLRATPEPAAVGRTGRSGRRLIIVDLMTTVAATDARRIDTVARPRAADEWRNGAGDRLSGMRSIRRRSRALPPPTRPAPGPASRRRRRRNPITRTKRRRNRHLRAGRVKKRSPDVVVVVVVGEAARYAALNYRETATNGRHRITPGRTLLAANGPRV